MNGSKIVILGGGMVAGYAAKQLVESGLKSGDLSILSADTAIPYERPPLSKGFLAGKDTEDGIRINPEEFYRTHGIELKLGCRITGVNSDNKRLTLASGENFTFEKLIVATGARPRVLEVPGAKLGNVFYLRSLENSKEIRQAAENVRSAVVIGGGFIGMEVTAVLTQKGLRVSMALSEERIWKKFFTPEMSRFFETYYTSRGVQFFKGAGVRELRGDGAVNSAVLADGRTIPCEMVVAGIGVRPVTDMLAGSGIETGDGVMVNEYLESSRPDILAAGDVANYPDLLFNKRRRVEHWDNAVTQGQYCARTLMGERTPFKHVPYFFSDVFDLSYEFWGDGAEADQVVHRGDTAGNSFSAWWLRRGCVVAAFTMNRPDEERTAAPSWIEARQVVDPSVLADAGRPISSAAQAS